MRPPLSRAQQPPPELPAQGRRGGNCSEPRNRVQGKETHPERLPSSLVAGKASSLEVKISPSRFFRSGNSEDNCNPEPMGRPTRNAGVMMYEDV